ncbi:hypothetical protein [Bacillus pumilus]|uniref:hypothetical protein n=1 Tax=Bacillus pumilus TaxID=1408 RepID=UPI0011A31BB3|nr:hypothetical protein [Bacillus pumilus]
MPYNVYEVPAELFLTVNDIDIYYAYQEERGVYSFSWSEADKFEVVRLPLFDEDMESSYESREDYHRHLIIASIARGDLDFAMINPFPFSVDFQSYKPDDLGNKLKAIVTFESNGEWCFIDGIGGSLDKLEETGYHYLTLRNEFDEDMMKFHIKDDTEIKRFFDVLFHKQKKGDIQNKEVLLSFLDCHSNNHTVYIEDELGHFSFGNHSFQVRELPLYKEDMLQLLTKEKGLTSRQYDSYLILSSIVNGHLDDYMGQPFTNPIDCNDWSIRDIKEKRIEIFILLNGDGYWNLDSSGGIEIVDVSSYDYLSIIVERDILIDEFSIETESSMVDRDLQVKTLLDIMFDLNGELIFFNEKL